MNRHARFLLDLVDCLNIRYAWERSFRLCRGALLTNRFLLTLTKEAIEKSPDDTILSVCRRLQMPQTLVETARDNLPAARFVHFGFEENESSCLYKVYLEFDGKKAVPGSTFLLHLAFKWDIADRTRHFLTHYLWYPSLSAGGILDRLATIYRDGSCPESFELARGIVSLAAARPGHQMAYLEVTEPASERRSFDLNIYDALFQVQDLHPLLRQMSEHFAVPAIPFSDLYERIKVKRFGHVAGGIHRGGQDFFNLYYGVEWRQGKALSGFGSPSSPDQTDELVGRIANPSHVNAAAATPTRSASEGSPDVAAIHVPSPGAAMKTADRLELTTDQDQYYNYCWWPYVPVAPPENKFRPAGLLLHSFEVAGLDERAFELVRTIQAAIGLFRTVYGVKWIGQHLAWEFYFYDYQRREREISISRVLEAIRPIIRCDVKVNESLPYFMFSLDVNGELVSGKKDLDVVHMYIGNPGSRVSSGIAYALTASASVLENFYFFFDARRDLRQAAEKVLNSAHVDPARMDINRILRPELRDCNTICVANKQKTDTAYFSGVNVDQLLFFLKLLNYPSAIIGFAEENRGKLDHLLYDVGFDYVTQGEDLVMVKSGYYGVF
jgi:hypothetical protein